MGIPPADEAPPRLSDSRYRIARSLRHLLRNRRRLFLDGGAGILQIRHKSHWDRAIFESAGIVARLCREAGVTLIINDRADFAMLLNAGLHLGQDDLSPRDARRLAGPDIVIGFSSHNVNQLCAAGGEPVDYVALGPSSPPPPNATRTPSPASRRSAAAVPSSKSPSSPSAALPRRMRSTSCAPEPTP